MDGQTVSVEVLGLTLKTRGQHLIVSAHLEVAARRHMGLS